ncbi:MAG: S9 family peptidase [Bacteroidetes bacterium]|nr:S9 family peptidase [Bacteroidota bacterium]
MNAKTPSAKKKEHILTTHNHSRNDEYYWMNERDCKDVVEYLEEENAYANQYFSGSEGLQQKIYDEILGRIDPKEESVPYLYNNYYYYSRFEEGKEYPIYCRKEGSLEATEEILLNVNSLAEGKSYCSVGNVEVSDDQKYVVYSVDFVSRRQYDIYFENRLTGEIEKTIITNTSGEFVMANDSRTIFFTKKDDALRPYQAYRYVIGQEEDSQELIFQEDDELFVLGVSKSKTDKYIFISSNSTLTSEYHFLSADHPQNPLKVFHSREKKIEYTVFPGQGKFYILTNWNAVNFKLMECDENATDKSAWRELISHKDDVLIQDVEVFANYLVVDERINGLSQFRVIDLKSAQSYYVDFGEPAYAAGMYANYEFQSEILRYHFSSLKTPTTTIDIHLNSQKKEIKKVQKVIGGHNPDNYITERIWAVARDGKQVPMSVVYAKDTKIDGSQPTLLYGYGSYGIIVDPQFSVARLSLLDRGFIYVIAHIRGGQDLGRQWYEDGKFLKKKNTFYDFIDCAEHLIKNNYASANTLFAMGGSAGGMLMGGIVNMRHDLFKGIVAQVPFVDVVTTMLDDSIPLTVGEYEEWGNPNEEEYYHYMLSYSPYDNVEAKNYPAIFVETGYHDSQVQYWEPAKWVAKLREMKTNDSALIFKCNMETGHGGASGRYQRFKEIALEYTFLLTLAQSNR